MADTILTKTSVATALSSSATAKSSYGATLNNDGTIVQTERLLTARPRYAPKATDVASVYAGALTTRGTTAYIKLLTTKAKAQAYATTRGLRESPELTGPNSALARMSSSDSSTGYSDFLLTAVSFDFQEKLQVTETFGDGEVAYYFGRQPITMDISGVLPDSPDNPWFTNWLTLYAGAARGTALAQNYELLQLVLPNMTVTATMSGCGFRQSSENDVAIQFSARLLVKRMVPTAPVLQNVSDAALGDLVDFSQAASFVSQQNINSYKAKVASLTSLVSNPLSSTYSIAQALTSLGSGMSSRNPSASLGPAGAKSSPYSFSNGLGPTVAMFNSISANLNGARAQIVSPIYGVLTGLTKLVQATTNDLTSIYKSITSPVRNVLRDITNISKAATSLVALVNSSIRGLGRGFSSELAGIQSDYKTAIKSIGVARGAIASLPQSAVQNLKAGLNNGRVNPSGSALLKSYPSASISRPYSLSSKPRPTTYKVLMLTSVSTPTPSKSGAL